MYGKDVIKSEEEYKEKINSNFEKIYNDESNFRFGVDAKDILLEKAKLKLPDEFLKKFGFDTVVSEGDSIAKLQLVIDEVIPQFRELFDRVQSILKQHRH